MKSYNSREPTETFRMIYIILLCVSKGQIFRLYDLFLRLSHGLKLTPLIFWFILYKLSLWWSVLTSSNSWMAISENFLQVSINKVASYNHYIFSIVVGFVFGLLDLFWLFLVWMVLFLYKRIVFITRILEILRSVNTKPKRCEIRWV